MRPFAAYCLSRGEKVAWSANKGYVAELMLVIHSLRKFDIEHLVSLRTVVNRVDILWRSRHASCNSTVRGNKIMATPVHIDGSIFCFDGVI